MWVRGVVGISGGGCLYRSLDKEMVGRGKGGIGVFRFWGVW